MLRTRCCVRVTRTFTLTPKKEQQKSKVNFNYELISFQKFDKTSNNRIKLNAMLISPSNWRLKKIQLNHVARWKIKICTIDRKLCVGSINKQWNTVHFLLDTHTLVVKQFCMHISRGPLVHYLAFWLLRRDQGFGFLFP
jgi:glutathione peroxidase-family protein